MIIGEEITRCSKEEESKELINPLTNKKIFNHRSQITKEEMLSLKYSYYFIGFDKVVTEVVSQIKSMCPNVLHLLWFWHIKNSEVEKNWADFLEEYRDGYDRQDNFNVFGLAVYLNLACKPAIGMITDTLEVMR